PGQQPKRASNRAARSGSSSYALRRLGIFFCREFASRVLIRREYGNILAAESGRDEIIYTIFRFCAGLKYSKCGCVLSCHYIFPFWNESSENAMKRRSLRNRCTVDDSYAQKRPKSFQNREIRNARAEDRAAVQGGR